MIIKCWGARGSIAVSGQEYKKYGGATTCIEIRTRDGEVILVDAGTGIRKAGNRLVSEKKQKIHIIFTHAHWDHVLGFPFFKPIYFPGYAIHIYGHPFVQKTLKDMIANIMVAPYFPVPYDVLASTRTYYDCGTNSAGKFSIGSVEIEPIVLSHPNRVLGYKFTEDGKSFVFFTDNELTHKHPGSLEYEDYRNFCQNAELLLHDAEYTPEEYNFAKTWGHSIYHDALNLAIEANVKNFGLFHHNQERTDEQLDRMVEDCRKIAAEKNTRVNCFAPYEGWEIKI